MILNIEPKECPKCNGILEKYKSDPCEIEGLTYYQILGVFCPKGHYTYLDCM